LQSPKKNFFLAKKGDFSIFDKSYQKIGFWMARLELKTLEAETLI
jgi:hypothetical protein